MRRRQQVERPDRVDAPAVRRRQRVDGLLDDAEQRPQLLLGAVEVVGRQQPQGDHLDAGLVAPRRAGSRCCRPRPGGPRCAPAPRALAQRRLPSSITPTWRGHRRRVELPGEAAGVGGVQDVAEPHAPWPLACFRTPHREVADGAPTRTPAPWAAAGRAGRRTWSTCGAVTAPTLTYARVGYPRTMTQTEPTPGAEPSRREALEQRVETAIEHVKPKLRGWLHAGMTPVALVAGIILIVLAGTDHGEGLGGGLRRHRRAAVRHLGRLPPRHLVAARRRLPAPLRPLQHLPDHRRHLHAVRAAAAAGPGPSGC